MKNIKEKVACGRNRRTKGIMSALLFVIIATFAVSNVAKANDTTITIPLDLCSDAMLETEYCSDWSDWFDMPPHKLTFESLRHSKWPFGPKWYHCDVTVIYTNRQCNTNQYLHQYVIEAIVLDLGYRVWSLQSGGWVYPCREALEILKGDEKDVSLAFNQLYDEIYKALVLDLYDMVFHAWGPNYARCNDLDPTNPSVKPLTVVSTKSSCQGTCFTYQPDRSFPIPINDRIWHLQDFAPTMSYLAEKYNGGATEGLIVEPIDSAGIADLNDYIQTEINPFIVEDWRKIPIFSGDGFTIIATPIPCAPDFCCLNRLDICQGDDRKAHIHQTITGDIPEACMLNLPTNVNCPPSPLPPQKVECAANCGIGSYDYDVDDLTTYVEDNTSPKINIYPNPTNKLVKFDVPTDQILNNLELFDVNGNLLSKFNTNSTTLDLSGYNSGKYYICFTLNNTKHYRSITLSK